MAPVQDADEPEANRREYPPRAIASAAAWVFRGDKVLLIKRGQASSKGRWSVPGGAIELGEALHDAVKRELREECGVEIDLAGLIDVVDNIVWDDQGRIQFHYVVTYLMARHLSGEARPGSDALQVRWVTREEVHALDMHPVIRESLRIAFNIARDTGLF